MRIELVQFEVMIIPIYFIINSKHDNFVDRTDLKNKLILIDIIKDVGDKMERFLIEGRINDNGVVRKGFILGDEMRGVILEVGYGDRSFEGFGGNRYSYGEEFVINVGDFNGHSHPEQSLYTDIVDKSWDLPTWCRNTIYKYSPLLKPEYVYYSCCRAFSRMLALGVTSVMASFYCHNNKGNEFDREVIRAARDTGIRLYFGRMNYDIINHDAYIEKVKSQKCFYETPGDAEESFDELLKEKYGEAIVVAPAIHSIHASTKEAIVRSINLGNKNDRYIQFHLSEDKGDVDMSLRLYNKRPIEFLVELLKNGDIETLENMMLSDCVWIDDNERKLIKEYDMKVVLNPRMNDRIKTGEADLYKLIEEGIYPYLGTDGEASNDDLSISGEREFLKLRFDTLSKQMIDDLGKQTFKFGNENIGEIKINNYCDLKILKNNIVSDVFVGGKRVVECGKLLTLDVDNYIEKNIKEIWKSI